MASPLHFHTQRAGALVQINDCNQPPPLFNGSQTEQIGYGKVILFDGCLYGYIALGMKTTIDLPEAILHRAKIVAAQRRTTLKELVLTGLDHVLSAPQGGQANEAALNLLRKGLHLGGTPMKREEVHARR